jgi:hypothetical protein
MATIRGVHLKTLMRGIYEIFRGDGFRCHDIYPKFCEDWFRHSEVDKEGYTDTKGARFSHKPTFIFSKKESGLK